jgi:hypothetical protein
MQGQDELFDGSVEEGVLVFEMRVNGLLGYPGLAGHGAHAHPVTVAQEQGARRLEHPLLPVGRRAVFQIRHYLYLLDYTVQFRISPSLPSTVAKPIRTRIVAMHRSCPFDVRAKCVATYGLNAALR